MTEQNVSYTSLTTDPIWMRFFNKMMSKIKASAAKRSQSKRDEHPIEITTDQLAQIWIMQNGRSYYTGNPLDIDGEGLNAVSVDRINSEIGYVLGNICFVTQFENLGKNRATIEEFRDFWEKGGWPYDPNWSFAVTPLHNPEMEVPIKYDLVIDLKSSFLKLCNANTTKTTKSSKKHAQKILNVPVNTRKTSLYYPNFQGTTLYDLWEMNKVQNMTVRQIADHFDVKEKAMGNYFERKINPMMTAA